MAFVIIGSTTDFHNSIVKTLSHVFEDLPETAPPAKDFHLPPVSAISGVLIVNLLGIFNTLIAVVSEVVLEYADCIPSSLFNILDTNLYIYFFFLFSE